MVHDIMVFIICTILMTHLGQTCATGSNPSIVSSNQQQLKMWDVSMNSQFTKTWSE
jgi:hypothetical protein